MPESVTEDTSMFSYQTKRQAADTTLWLITATWFGYPLLKGAWTILFGSFTGMLVLETLLLTVGCAMASSKVTEVRDRLKMKEREQLDPHEYDEDVLYWEEGDPLKLKENEDDSTMDAEFIGFTDDNTVVVEENNYPSDDTLHEFSLPELESYKNEEAQDRKSEAEREQLLAKVDNSFYNEKLDQLREIRDERQKVLDEINADPELQEFEDKLDNEGRLPESTDQPELTRTKNRA